MGFDHRKLLTKAQTSLNSVRRFCVMHCNSDKDCGSSSQSCPNNCSQRCTYKFLPWVPHLPQPPPPPPPPPPMSHSSGLGSTSNHFVSASMTVMASMIGICFLFGIFCAAIRLYYLRRNTSRRGDPPIFFGTQNDFVDDDQGPTFDHPIWYINTVGLPQSVIDSITVCKYKTDEGLIDGTDCSVCLSEFEEDENLRLLPKCSHAFHIPCIDTWLRSHKNCPLCRAPVICGTVAAQANGVEPSLNDLDSRNDNTMENHIGEETNNIGEGGTSQVRNGQDDSFVFPIEDIYTAENSKKPDSRVLSDLTDNRRVVEEEMQPMRRSVSLDSSSAMTIYKDVANVVVNGKHQRSFDTQSSKSSKSSKSNNSKSKMVAKPSTVSSSISKMMKSSSIGNSLQKGPISMKRSFSFSGKRSSTRHSRRHAVLPL